MSSLELSSEFELNSKDMLVFQIKSSTSNGK